MFADVTHASGDAKVIVFFMCPYGVSRSKLSWAIKKLVKTGYTVISYEYPREIFRSGDPELLFTYVSETDQSMQKFIKDNPGKEFGFFGSSLGAFVGYNCMARVPELSWGILNTGGSITEAVLNFDAERNAFYGKGYSRKQMEKIWHPLQYPTFGDLSGKKFMLLASKGDKTVSYTSALDCAEHIRKSGATVEMVTYRRYGHKTTVIHNLLRIDKLVAQVRAIAPH